MSKNVHWPKIPVGGTPYNGLGGKAPPETPEFSRRSIWKETGGLQNSRTEIPFSAGCLVFDSQLVRMTPLGGGETPNEEL